MLARVTVLFLTIVGTYLVLSVLESQARAQKFALFTVMSMTNTMRRLYAMPRGRGEACHEEDGGREATTSTDHR